MAEDPTTPMAGFMAALQERGQKKNAKGVVKDKVNPVLTPQESQRYTNIFKIMAEVLEPKEEVKSVKKSKTDATPGIAGQITNNMTGGIGSGMGNLATLLGAGLIGTALAAVTDKEHLITMALKVSKLLPIKLLKGLPLIGSILNFGFAYKAFNDNKPGKGLWELTSGIAGLVPGVGSAISIGMDMLMYMFEQEEAKAEENGEELDFGNWMSAKMTEIGSVIWTKLKAGKIPFFSGLFKFGEGIGHFMATDWKKGLEAWNEILPSFFGMGGDGQEDFWRALSAMGSMLTESAPVQKGMELAGDAFGWLKDMMEKIGTIFLDFYKGVVDWIDNTIEAGKKKINEALPVDIFETEDDESNVPAPIEAATDIGAYLNPLTGPAKMAGAAANYFIRDGIIAKDGKVTAFDDQDDILAAKSGGPIDKLLDSNSKVMQSGGPIDKLLDGNSKVMQTIASINTQQLNVLREIRDGIKALQSSSSSFADTSLTTQFYA